jgi:hypothetical protein
MDIFKMSKIEFRISNPENSFPAFFGNNIKYRNITNMEFAYVTFVNNNETYINLMKSTIKSVEVFSRYPIIVYCVDIPEDRNPFSASERCIIRNISMTCIDHKNIYYMKPYVIIDAIKQGLKSGYYIESDDLLTPCGDSIIPFTKNLDAYPISPIHPDDVNVSEAFMQHIDVSKKTQHYIHGHVLFKATNLAFLEDWMANCLISSGEHWDESVLNCMYWKHNLTQHYLEIIDPWYQSFYKDPAIIEKVMTLHGCKNPDEHATILEKMIEYNLQENKVSVVIPTYNRFTYVQNTLQSIRNQTYKNIEIILVNDCSTQPEYYTYVWPADIKIIHLEKNTKALLGYASCAHVRNQGIPLATGKYIAFCDDDDSWFPRKIELQLKAMKETGCRMSSTDGLVGHGVFNATNQNIVYSGYFNFNLPEIWTLDLMKKGNYMLGSSVMLEKTLLNKIKNFATLKPPTEDYECWLRALEHTNSVYVKDIGVYYDLAHGDGRNYEL